MVLEKEIINMVANNPAARKNYKIITRDVRMGFGDPEEVIDRISRKHRNSDNEFYENLNDILNEWNDKVPKKAHTQTLVMVLKNVGCVALADAIELKVSDNSHQRSQFKGSSVPTIQAPHASGSHAIPIEDTKHSGQVFGQSQKTEIQGACGTESVFGGLKYGPMSSGNVQKEHVMTEAKVAVKFENGDRMVPLGGIYDAEQNWGRFGQLIENINTVKMKLAEQNHPVCVAVLDSGIERDHTVFEDGSRFHQGNLHKNYVFGDGADLFQDDTGHGTGVASIIARFTPSNVKIVSMKVSTEETILSAFTDLNDESYGDVDIVSISLGSTRAATVLGTQIIAKIKDLQMKKIIIFAVGNDGDQRVETSQNFANTDGIAVGSSKSTGQRSDFSSRGPHLFCLAPGEQVPVARSTTRKDYYLADGTSFAAPYVAAVAALIMTRFLQAEPTDNCRQKLRNTPIMKQILRRLCQCSESWNDEKGYDKIDVSTQKLEQVLTEAREGRFT